MTIKPLILSFSLLAFAGMNAHADEAKQSQQQQSQQAGAGGTQAAQQRGELRASNLAGMQVVNAKGEEIGEIDDLVIDLNSGRVHAAVLGFGGFMGIGEENYAFPLRELKPGKQADQVVLDIDKQALEDRKGFSKSKWPGMDDEYWSRVGGRQAGAGATAGQAAGRMNLVRSSELIGKEVQAKGGRQAGEVQDVIVGLQNGQVKSYVVGIEDGGRATVPAKALKMSGTDNRLVLDMSADQLRSQAKSSRKAK